MSQSQAHLGQWPRARDLVAGSAIALAITIVTSASNAFSTDHTISAPSSATATIAAIAAIAAIADANTAAISTTNDRCGAPPNRWGYTLCSEGEVITSPPRDLCSEFDCINGFWGASTSGYVVQCADGRYSHAGGQPGACSSHGGISRPLRAPVTQRDR